MPVEDVTIKSAFDNARQRTFTIHTPEPLGHFNSGVNFILAPRIIRVYYLFDTDTHTHTTLTH